MTRRRWTGSARRALAGAGVFLLAVVPAGCDEPVPTAEIRVLERLPHDTLAYTQGLLFHNGVLYESTGRYGESDIRRVDPTSGQVLGISPLSEEFFGEGLARVEDRLIQLTWRERAALVWDLETLTIQDTLALETDGWGLCYDGASLWATSGGSILFRRDPETFQVLGNIQATEDGTRLGRINELECVGDYIYANIYQTSEIVKIAKATGEVVLRFDGSALIPPGFAGNSDAVLNGIAWIPGTDNFYLTGKLWPVLYRVELVEP